MANSSSSTRASAAAVRRRARENEILAATRALFDESGVRDAQIEDIAKAVGVNRAIIYRHFAGKEELFALTLVGYLDELAVRLGAAAARPGPRSRARAKPVEPRAIDALTAVVGEFVDFGLEHPAFVDCAQTLMRRTGPELLDEISESAMFRLGRAIAACLKQLTEVIDAGIEAGEFHQVDSDVLANHMYATGLGALQLARVGMLVKEAAPGIPSVAPVSGEQVKSFLVSTARALAVG